MYNMKYEALMAKHLVVLKSCGIHTAKLLNHVCPFFNIMHKRVNRCVYYDINLIIQKAAKSVNINRKIMQKFNELNGT